MDVVSRAFCAMSKTKDRTQDAVDHVVWALYARPRAVPSYGNVMMVADALKASGTLAVHATVGHYVLDRHIPGQDMAFGNALVGEDDIPAARLAQLAAGVPPTPQETLLWRRRWTQRALSEPVEHELPVYNIGTIRARTGERACWLATIEGGVDAYLGIELFGFACSIEEIFARFRATVVAATLPYEISAALGR